MKQKIISTSLFVFIIIIIDFIYTRFGLKDHSNRYDKIYFIIISILLFIMVSNITYKVLFDFRKNTTRAVISILIIFLFSMFIADRFVAISKYYLYSINIPKRSSFNLWQLDDKLAHKGVPLSKGFYEYFIGDSISGKIEIQFDSLGFRSPTTENRINSDTLNLFLGCSFTFGDFILAEDGYPYKLSTLLNQNFINAGASAYGLAQMIQLSDSLIPKYSFNYVFIQYSPWLADRAISFNGPTYYEHRPFPYFSENNNKFFLEGVPYKVKKRKRDWRLKNGYIDKLRFYFTSGIEEEIVNYFSFKWAVLKSKIGLLKKPTENKNQLEVYFYQHLINLCKSNNATPVILKLGFNDTKSENIALLELLSKKNIKMVDLDSALRLETTDSSNLKRYEIYHELGNGNRIYYDGHPNSLANSIFSDAIFNSLK